MLQIIRRSCPSTWNVALIGQMHGLMFALPQCLSFSDTVEKIGISTGSVGPGLQSLRSLGAINESKLTGKGLTGSRNAGHAPELSLRKLAGDLLCRRVVPMTALGKGSLKWLRQPAQQALPEKKFNLDRVKQLEIWWWQIKTIMPMLVVLLGSGSRD